MHPSNTLLPQARGRRWEISHTESLSPGHETPFLPGYLPRMASVKPTYCLHHAAKSGKGPEHRGSHLAASLMHGLRDTGTRMDKRHHSRACFTPGRLARHWAGAETTRGRRLSPTEHNDISSYDGHSGDASGAEEYDNGILGTRQTHGVGAQGQVSDGTGTRTGRLIKSDEPAG